ncbi:hypothetical protein A2U01_0051689, partial [Trifolium medium]|nr:hypothetical protein [Trifolium medium]
RKRPGRAGRKLGEPRSEANRNWERSRMKAGNGRH